MRKFLTKKLPGFMGRTHAVLSICLLFVCMLIPLEFFQKTVWTLKENILLCIVGFVLVVGGALLPDLDNPAGSSASYSTGPLGSLVSGFMQATSGITWSIYRMRNDKRPLNQHRFLWHAPIIGIGFILLFWHLLPKGEYSIFIDIKNSISTNNILLFIQKNAVLVLFLLTSFMAALAGSSMIVSKLRKVFPVIPSQVKFILPALILIYVLFVAQYSQIRILGVCIGLGYTFHILEDFFTDGSIPLIWPIPNVIKKKVWWKPKLPFLIETGGIINLVIDFIGIAAMIILGLVVFTK